MILKKVCKYLQTFFNTSIFLLERKIVGFRHGRNIFYLVFRYRGAHHRGFCLNFFNSPTFEVREIRYLSVVLPFAPTQIEIHFNIIVQLNGL